MTVARLGYEIDSSGAVKAAGDLGKMSDAAKVAETQQQALTSATGELNRLTGKASAEFLRLKASEDSAFAAAVKLKQAQDLLNAELAAGNINADQYAASLGNLEARYRSQIAVVGKFSGAMQGSASQTANLGAQLNDIGVMLAAGQSPLQLAVQQGTQINQVFAQMGGGRAALRGLAAGFMSMVNPMSLATIGIIAGGAALVQWGVSALDAGSDADEFEDALDDLASVMDLVEGVTDTISTSTDDLIQKYGMAATRVREFALAQAELAQSQAERRLRDQVGLLDTVTDRYAAVGEAVEVAGYKMENDLPIANLRKDLGVTADQAFILMDAFTALDNADTFRGQQEALSGILETMNDQGVALSLLPPELQSAVSEMITLSNEADAAKAAMDRLAGAAANVSVGVPLFMQGFSPEGLLPPEALPRDPKSRRGGGSRTDVFARDLEQLRESLRTEQEVIDEWYLEQQEILANQRAMEILGIEGHNEAKLRLEAEYNERKKELQDEQAQYVVNAQAAAQGAALDFLGTLAGQSEGAAKALIAINTGLSIAEAIQNTATAATKALAIYGPTPQGFAAAGAVKAYGAAQVALIAANGALKIGRTGSSSSGAGSASSAGVTATSAPTAAPQRQDAVIQLEGALADVLAPLMDSIVSELQSRSEDGVNIVGVTAR